MINTSELCSLYKYLQFVGFQCLMKIFLTIYIKVSIFTFILKHISKNITKIKNNEKYLHYLQSIHRPFKGPYVAAF